MPESNTEPTNTQKQPSLERIKKECGAMMKLLTKLEQEEFDLRAQNEVLARAALLAGFSPGVLEPPAPKRRRRKQEGNTTAEAHQSSTANS